ncbi:ATP-dependent RNA helicase DeaD [Actinomycetospora sp. NBRC 106375]|uniref:DEAD/DEAH box helicase n=1 Tax=Actinomycetospora sp. NBRC 106375 TaxID=3032207 RepID=UPI0024A5A706|nr:DEAD/DEAH box helicase [Actinomycetospora sp. NBRC 106375]GLZ47180.1 ATP-dependent RNA helicase DeaD [Actinomycetospora sp. NBRC 106375]
MTNAAVLTDHDVELVDVIAPSTSDDADTAPEIPEAADEATHQNDETPEPAASEPDVPASGFAALGLDERLLGTLAEAGFETPTPIQTETIPLLLDGRDVLGLAQTGTGKTAAFALPMLSAIEPSQKNVQALVLTPTRELAIQVAEAIERLGTAVRGLEVVQLYGGAPYGPQLHGLRRGGQIVVGTPGRVADHLEKGTLDLSNVAHFVLDEADEMLQMGFLEEVEALFEKLPDQRQVALFSATMPAAIREVSRRHLNAPAEVSIKSKTQTGVNTRQRYVVLPERLKADALSRVLQVEDFDACLVFVRTRQNTTDVTEALNRRGFAAVAISGDLSQVQREKTIADLRSGKIDVLVATDVAARGLDVDRISLVVNHDLPTDPESYVHRIGRTGRAGRSGEAISFVTRGQIRTMRMIEGVTKQKAEEMSVPGTDEVNEVRKRRFADRITGTLDGTVTGGDPMDVYRGIVGDYVAETGVDPLELAASLAKMVQGDKPLLVEDLPAPPPRGERPDKRGARDGKPDRGQGRGKAPSWDVGSGRDTYRIDVGHNQRVRPGAIVGAIANEAGLDSAHIGHIDIRPDHTLVELPDNVPGPVVKRLQRARVAGRPMGLRRASGDEKASDRGDRPRGPKRR